MPLAGWKRLATLPGNCCEKRRATKARLDPWGVPERGFLGKSIVYNVFLSKKSLLTNPNNDPIIKNN
jgi:hypothetical protein